VFIQSTDHSFQRCLGVSGPSGTDLIEFADHGFTSCTSTTDTVGS
jgi:hypothetical protein